jgi:hypothetical protein
MELLREKLERGEGRDLLGLDGLRSVNGQRDSLELSPRQVVYILRSTLALADDRERGDIRYWTKRMLENAP